MKDIMGEYMEDIDVEVKGEIIEKEGEERKMWSRGSDGDKEKPFTILDHISLIQKIKGRLEEKIPLSSLFKIPLLAMRQGEELRAQINKSKKDAVEKMFKVGIFQKTDQTSILCTSCSVKFQMAKAWETIKARKKRANMLLIMHLLGAKHRMKLKLRLAENSHLKFPFKLIHNP